MTDGARRALGAALLLALAAAAPAAAQMSPEEEQRCVWSCLYNSPGAESREYQQCVARMCTAPQAAQPRRQPRAQAPAAPKAAWTAGGRGAGRYAGVEIAGKSFGFLCQRGGPGLIAIAGFGARGDGMTLRIDRQAYDLRFVTENGILYTAASSQLLRALMNGGAVHVARQGASASFPLAGSTAAIRKALDGCGLKG